jgi:hypothetical protein
MNFKVFRERFLSKKLTENAPDYFVKENWLLITASGTIGIPILATKEKESYFVSHDLIRFVPRGDTPVGYLYAWLASRLAKPLMTRQEYGGIIKHLEPHQIESLPVPLLPDEEIREIDTTIRRAWALREEANRLEEKALAALERRFE